MSTKLSTIDSGSKHTKTTGMLCGVKNNKLIGSLKDIESCLIWRLTILGVGRNCAGRICSIKISRNSKGPLINKITNNRAVNMIFYLLLFYCPASMLSCINNSKEFSLKVDVSGLWSRYLIILFRLPNVRAGESLYSIGLVKYLDGKLSIVTILQNHMSVKDILWTLYYLEEGNSIWGSMLYAPLIIP